MDEQMNTKLKIPEVVLNTSSGMDLFVLITSLKSPSLFFLSFFCFTDFHYWHKHSKSQSIIMSIQK